MSYKGETFKYDSLGNPTTYRDNTLVWERGRQLKSFGDKATYTYNVSGIRTSKQVGNTTTNYFLDGTRILAQLDTVTGVDDTTVTTTTEYIYGADGITGFVLNGTPYYYKKNLQGDIIGILDSNLQIVTKYAYDAWGNFRIYCYNGTKFIDMTDETSYTDTDANEIALSNRYLALKNPFRYRSYYFDIETGLYYLNTRYYDPETGRFINIDDINVIDTTKDFTNGINLYAYCLDNPINDSDTEGNLSLWQWLLVGIGVLVVVASVAVVAVAASGVALGVAGTVALGAAKGALIGAAVGTIGGGIIGGATSGWSLSGILTGMAIGFGFGAVVGAVIGASVAGVQVANAASMWSKGTFKSGFQSMKYHFNKHVISEGIRGKNIIQYTQDAVQFFSKNKSIAIWKTYSNPLKQPGWLINNNFGKGLYDSMQKIIYFLYK